jgi:hypothetical protein
MNRMFSLIILAAAISLETSYAQAQNFESGDWAVSNIRIDQQSVYVTLNPAPVACGGGNNFGAHIVFKSAVPNFQQLFASALTAYTSGARLSGIWFSNAGPCANATDALNTYMIRFKDK